MQGMITSFQHEKLRISDVSKHMDDCMIPVNVEKRRHELERFAEALDRLKGDFADAVRTDDGYEGSAESEQRIRDARRNIEPKIRHFEQVEAEMHAVMRNKFCTWTAAECRTIERQEVKVRELSGFRDQVAAEHASLTACQADVDELNAMLLA